MGQLSLKMLAGAIAGIAIWMLFEPFAPPAVGEAWENWENLFVLVLGAAIGLTVGGLNGWIQGSKIHLLRGAGLGMFFGAIGASLGHAIGGQIAVAVFGNNVIGNATTNLATATIARTVALTPIGVCLGVAIGASSLNKRRIIQGAIGGLIGAAIGGMVFDTLCTVIGPLSATLQGAHHGHTAEIGAPARALYAGLLGGLIALFIGIVDLLARSAWIRLVLGRNEGKEWPVDAAQTFIGRNERAGIPLFGDPNVAPMHACIAKQGNTYSISDGGSAAGTLVNGQRIQSAALFHGAQIQIGSYQLQFLMKNGAAPARGPEHFNQAYAIQHGGQPQAPVSFPSQAPPAQAGPAPGSIYGSQPTQAMPSPSGQYQPQPQMQPTVAFQNPASQQTVAYTPSAGGFTLAAMDGPLMGQRFPVRAVIELGRESASVPMSFDTGASRRHASVAPGPMGLMVTDLNSTNGTFVNGQRVQSANAGPGDLIKIGGTTFRVEPG